LVIITNNGQVKEYGKIMKNIYIASIIVILFVSGCITITPPTTPAAASAVVGTAMVVKLLMPVAIAAGIGILIKHQLDKPDRCESPVKSEDIQYCSDLRQAEAMRKLNLH